MPSVVQEAAEALAGSRHCIAFTGAGVSAESGIPTFRGRDGLWRRFRAEDLATPEAFARDPVLVWEWYRWRMGIVFRARPNPAHRALARLEELGVVKCLITQNVDGLHRLAGSRNVIELHGSLRRVRCVSCGFRSGIDSPPDTIPPRCPRCGGLLRPDVVWFGEPIPHDEWERAVGEAEKADAILVVGTSGVVYPAAYIPYIVKERGGIVVEVNVEPSSLTGIADYFIRDRASHALQEVLAAVERLLSQR